MCFDLSSQLCKGSLSAVGPLQLLNISTSGKINYKMAKIFLGYDGRGLTIIFFLADFFLQSELKIRQLPTLLKRFFCCDFDVNIQDL